MTKKTILFFLFIIAATPSFSWENGKSKTQIAVVLYNYKLAMDRDSFRIVEPFLTNDFRISSMPPGIGSKMLLMGLVNAKTGKHFSYKIKKITTSHDTIYVKAKVSLGNNKAVMEHFSFVKEQDVLKIDYMQGSVIDLLQGKKPDGSIEVSTTVSKKDVKDYFNMSPDSLTASMDQVNRVVKGDTINRVNSDQQPTGKWARVYDDGSLQCEGEYVNGKKEGFWRRYYKNRNLMYECYYHENKYHGLCKNYYENGNLQDEGIYINGAPDGVIKKYYQNGQLERTEYYDKGKLACPCAYYDENGRQVRKPKKRKKMISRFDD